MKGKLSQYKLRDELLNSYSLAFLKDDKGTDDETIISISQKCTHTERNLKPLLHAALRKPTKEVSP